MPSNAFLQGDEDVATPYLFSNGGSVGMRPSRFALQRSARLLPSAASASPSNKSMAPSAIRVASKADSKKAGPRLSVVITTDTFDTVRRALVSFGQQEDPTLLEMVLVSPPGGLANADEALLARFGRIQIVEVPEVHHLARANAAGAAAATCPFVCIGETHCFPDRGWTQALLEAHATGVTAVLCAIDNARPAKLLDTAGYALDYARIGSHHPPGSRHCGLGHNTSYQRGYLQDLGSQLPISFDYFSEQAQALFERHRATLLFAPAAVARHFSVGGVVHAPFYRFIVGVKLGGSRRRRWPFHRSGLCFLATPILPFLLVWRERGHAAGIRDHHFPFPLLLVSMLHLAFFKSLGEAFGLLFGIPAWVQAFEADMETRRLEFGHASMS